MTSTRPGCSWNPWRSLQPLRRGVAPGKCPGSHDAVAARPSTKRSRTLGMEPLVSRLPRSRTRANKYRYRDRAFRAEDDAGGHSRIRRLHFQARREPDQMRARAEARLALSTESGYAAGRALSEIYLGWAEVLAGDLDGGIVRMKRHLSESSSRLRGRGRLSPGPDSYALGKAGQFDEAHCSIEKSFSIIDGAGQRHCEAEVHRLKGELLLAQRARMPPMRRNVSAPRSRLRATSSQRHGSCARRRVSRACSRSSASTTRRARC